MTDSNDWFQKSINSLALNGKAERTQEAYTRALRMLCEFHGNKVPEAITEAHGLFALRRGAQAAAGDARGDTPACAVIACGSGGIRCRAIVGVL